MNSFIWIKGWFIIMMLFIPMISLFNYIIDPYGFNNKILINNVNTIKEKNTNFTIEYKIPKLREGGWDNLMMGTSSIGVMDNNVVNKHLGGKTFNLSQPASAMPIQLDSFMYAVHYNDIKNVIYNVDFISFNKNRKINPDYLQLKNKLQSFDNIYSYNMYINWSTFMSSLKLLWNNYIGNITPSAKYLENGQHIYQNYLYAYKTNKFDAQKNMNSVTTFLLGENGYYENYTYSQKYMDQFKKIVTYCKENNIHLYVYISPLYKDFLINMAKSGIYDEFEYFKEELSKVTDFIDFTQDNEIIDNINNFWDPLHLRTEITPMIMDDVLIQSSKDLKYGIYVKQKTSKSVK